MQEELLLSDFWTGTWLAAGGSTPTDASSDVMHRSWCTCCGRRRPAIWSIQVLVDDPTNLEKIRKKECDVLKSRLNKII